MIESGSVDTLKERRKNAATKFALKAEKSARFSNKWFKPTVIESERQARETTRRKYVLKKARTNRAKSNPVYKLTQVLNSQ